jgi:beclin 1-associated autophagy-related key regulator
MDETLNSISFILEVKYLLFCFSDFCDHEMTDTEFAHRVAKLNSNVLHLCYTQNVNPELLHPARTLHNILLLLNTEVSDLGRYLIS